MRLRRREKSGGDISGRAIKNPLAQAAGLLSWAVVLGMRIPLSRVIGDESVGLFAPAFELFFLTRLFTSYAMTGAIAGVIRYRVKREQYRNAKRAFNAAFFMNLFVSVLAAALLLLFSRVIADILVLETNSRMAVMACGAAVVLASLIGTFRGCFNGYGLGLLTVHSQYIECVAMVVCTLFGSRMFYDYGLKVSALKQNSGLACAYGAMGAMLGVMLSQLIATIHLLMMYVIYAGTLRGQLGMDNSRRTEPRYYLQRALLSNSAPTALAAILSNLALPIDQRMFNYCMNSTDRGETRTALWGSFYGKYAVLIGIGTVLVLLCVNSMIGRIAGAYDREEYRVMRDRIGKAVRKLCIVAFPAAIYLAVLARAVVASLSFGGAEADVVSWLHQGAILIVLYGFCCLSAQIMSRVHMMRELLCAAAISLIVHVAAAYLLVQKAGLGGVGIVYAQLIFFGIYAALNFFLMTRNLKYRQEWLGSVAFPAAAAAVSGVVVGLVNRLLLEQVGGALTVLIGVAVGVFFYITFLMILRVIGEAELSRMPLGFFFIMLGKNIGVL